MKTLVTGATGFIGSAVVRRLIESNREVRCYVEPGAPRTNLEGLDVEIVEGDINDRDAVGRALGGVDRLFHLAGIYKLWLPDIRRIYEVNVEGTKTVMFAAMKAGVERVVHTSSIAAVGHPASGDLSDESCAFDLWKEANDYILSKWLSERDALRFAREGLPVVVVNPAFPFGEGDIGPTPTGQIVVDVLAGRAPGFVDGGINVVDVDDVAAGHVLAEQKGRVGERYILGNHNVTYEDFYRLITDVAGLPPIRRKLNTRMLWGLGWASERVARVTGKAPLITYRAARYATRKVWFDCRKAHEELGMPQTPLQETMEKAVRWFRAHGHA